VAGLEVDARRQRVLHADRVKFGTSREKDTTAMAMLKREELGTPVIPATSDLNALLGRGSEFEGKLSFEGTVRIDGKFNGSIVTKDVLVVGEGAVVTAEIDCGTVIVHGQIVGNIKAKGAVELHAPAKVKGNIETPTLMIEKGVTFDGQTKMEGTVCGSAGNESGRPPGVRSSLSRPPARRAPCGATDPTIAPVFLLFRRGRRRGAPRPVKRGEGAGFPRESPLDLIVAPCYEARPL
jgi:cytoskeletal protein CcmA (bactofilin family)